MFDERRIQRALVRILTADGKQTSGTGFFVGEYDVLTCFHVVSDAQGPIPIVLSDGSPAVATLDKDRSQPGADVAVLRVDRRGLDVLPCGTGAEPNQTAWAIGFERPSHYLQGPVPTGAVIEGGITVQSPRDPSYTYGGFALSDAVIRPGISGGPLVDRSTGVVIGIVGVEQFDRIEIRREGFALPGAQFSGYAIDLGDLVARFPTFADLLRQNRERIAAYGRYISPAGADELCRRQREVTLKELLRSRYDRKYYTPREIEGQIDSFLSSASKILPVVGNTGVGKTCLLGRLMDTLPESGETVVAIRGFHVRLESQKGGMADEIEASMSSAGYGLFAGLDRLIAAINPKPLVVLFDAVNEIPYTDQRLLRSWWARTVEWIGEKNVRVILTSRQPTWEMLLSDCGERLCFRPADPAPHRTVGDQRPKPGLSLGSFAPGEFEVALDRYGVANPTWDLAKLPFFLSVWSLLQDEWTTVSPDVTPSPLDLLDRYVEKVQQQVSHVTNGEITAIQVDRMLTDLGKAALEAKANAIPATAAEQQMTLPKARRAFIEENVVEEGRTHFRFAYDTLAEFYMSRHIQASTLSKDQYKKLCRYGLDSQGMAVGFAVIRSEHDNDRQTVNALLSNFAAEPDLYPVSVFMATARLLSHFHRPQLYFAHLESMAQKCEPRELIWPQSLDAIRQLVRSRRVPVRDVLELLRRPFVYDDPYTYEWGHWLGWTTEKFEEDCRHGPATVLLLAFDEQPKEVIDMLTLWLADKTAFEDRGSVKIQNVAAAVLFHRRSKAFEYLCEKLSEQSIGEAHVLLDHLFRLEPARGLELLERWFDRNDARYDYFVFRCNAVFHCKDNSQFDRRDAFLDKIRQRYLQPQHVGTEPYVRTVQLLSVSPQHRQLAFREIASALPQQWPRFKPELLLPFVADDAEQVLDVLRRCIAADLPGLTRDAVDVLHDFTTAPACVSAAVELLSQLVATDDHNLAFGVGRAIEDFLRFVPTDVLAREDVVRLARSCIEVGHSSARSCLLYYVCSTSHQPQAEELEQIEALAELFLEREADESNLTMLIESLADKTSTFVELLKRLEPLRLRLPRDSFELIVLRGVRPSSRVRNSRQEYLAQWTREADPSSLGPQFQSLHAAVAAGKSVTEAIEVAMGW